MKNKGEDFVRKSMQVKDDPLGHMCISAYVHVFKSVNVGMCECVHMCTCPCGFPNFILFPSARDSLSRRLKLFIYSPL